MTLVRDPTGTRLARVIFDPSGQPTGALELSDLLPTQVTRTSVPGYYRRGTELYLRVRVLTQPPPG